MNKMAVLNYLETPFKTGSKEGPNALWRGVLRIHGDWEVHRILDLRISVLSRIFLGTLILSLLCYIYIYIYIKHCEMKPPTETSQNCLFGKLKLHLKILYR